MTLEIQLDMTTGCYRVVAVRHDPEGKSLVVQANIRTREKADKVLAYWADIIGIDK